MFRVRKEAFAIIGKEGSTAEGEGFRDWIMLSRRS